MKITNENLDLVKEADLYFSQDRYEEALSLYLRSRLSSSNIHLKIGCCQMHQERFEDAIIELRKVKSSSKNIHLYLYFISMSFLSLGNFNQALIYSVRAISHNFLRLDSWSLLFFTVKMLFFRAIIGPFDLR